MSAIFFSWRRKNGISNDFNTLINSDKRYDASKFVLRNRNLRHIEAANINFCNAEQVWSVSASMNQIPSVYTTNAFPRKAVDSQKQWVERQTKLLPLQVDSSAACSQLQLVVETMPLLVATFRVVLPQVITTAAAKKMRATFNWKMFQDRLRQGTNDRQQPTGPLNNSEKCNKILT